MESDPEITQLFLQESSENLERLERQLLDLEDHPDDPELLASIFRSVHTIKGTSGFLGLPRLENLAHAGEELLAALRNGQIRLSTGVTTALLELVDAIRGTLGWIERTGDEGEEDHAETIVRLRSQLPGPTSDGEPAEPVPVDGDSQVAEPEPAGGQVAEPDSRHADAPQPAVAEPSEQPGGSEPVEPVPTAVVTASAPAPPPARPAGRQDGGPPAAEPARANDTTVRLGVDVLDKIMDLTGELVVLRSRLSAVIGDDEATSMTSISRDLRVVTADLQSEVMRSRLQPVGVVTGRFRRIARDLANSLGKELQVELTGEDVAVDRAINDALRDPLLHLVRNAVDHGLETPHERSAAGKGPVGSLRIAASHGHGRVRIDVSDDGRGVDPNALRRRAQASGLLTRDEADALSDREAVELALQPGVSTSHEVTTLSGRGVGLDVVRSVLATVGGRVDITSEPGRGTCFSVNVPLTLAMLPVLTLSCGGATYCLPQANVLEVRDVASDQAAVTEIDDVPIFRLRGQLLPLVDLAVVLAGRSGAAPASAPDRSDRVVILETDERRFALAVPATGDTLDVVVKPMTPETRGIPVFMGVSILADGQPALILDVAGVADAAGVTSRAETAVAPDLLSAPAGESAIVVARIAGGGTIAVRLADVVRLERFDRPTVKRRADGDAVMYADEIMPLILVSEVLPERRSLPRDDGAEPAGDESLETIVCRTSGRLVGLVVQRIVDVVPEPPAPSQPASRPGVIASICVDDRFAELLDLPVLLGAAGDGAGR